MTSITVRSNGKSIFLGLQRYGEKLTDTVDENMQEGMEEAAKEARGGYPDGTQGGYNVARRGSYERTGNLGASSYMQRNGMSYQFVSAAYRNGKPYNTYVLGDGYGSGQAWMHVGRWPIAYRVIEKYVNTITKRISDDIDALSVTGIGSIGGMY